MFQTDGVVMRLVKCIEGGLLYVGWDPKIPGIVKKNYLKYLYNFKVCHPCCAE